MPYRNISDDLEHATIRLYDRQILPMTDILDAVGLSHPTFFRVFNLTVLKQYRETGHVSKPKSLRRGRVRALNYSDVHHLLELVKQRPDWFLDELQHLLGTNRFVPVHYTTIDNTLERAGISQETLSGGTRTQ
ncbi:hypothetical protein K503DRAFT_750350 [Rhizopogon vinicolor AM-OR11-026]|uniref:Uncharacterized protein n=1 Tax=Rhizopogon vinicolor AM-OR11-026 TaxID=1314800 RepID=A0A1B7MH31_9AGAM|nr:hypothetical protein K503DRAFT_750350 [Rhizopogon vinicolor AM-OR11-026]